jgi:hypothetical protein
MFSMLVLDMVDTGNFSMLSAYVTLVLAVLEHDPEKWVPVFGQRSCSYKMMSEETDSTQLNQSLARIVRAFAFVARRIGVQPG